MSSAYVECGLCFFVPEISNTFLASLSDSQLEDEFEIFQKGQAVHRVRRPKRSHDYGHGLRAFARRRKGGRDHVNAWLRQQRLELCRLLG